MKKQKTALRNYIISYTFLVSEHELKDVSSFLEEYHIFLSDYSPEAYEDAALKEDLQCSVQ